MSYETKVILALISKQIGSAQTVRDAYMAVVEAANVEGLELPTYDEYLKKAGKKEPGQ